MPKSWDLSEESKKPTNLWQLIIYSRKEKKGKKEKLHTQQREEERVHNSSILGCVVQYHRI